MNRITFPHLRLNQTSVLLLLALTLLIAGCQNQEEPQLTAEAVSTSQIVADIAPVQATWTPLPALQPATEPAETDAGQAVTVAPPPSATPLPTATVDASPTAEETATPEETATEEPTATDEATATDVPAATAIPATAAPVQPTSPPVPPTVPADVQLGVNLLPNASFEEGHYNQNGIPELQLPNGWRLEFETGATGFGGQTWDVYVRPEIRVLSRAFLPESEHDLYIFNGGQTVKIFKGNGAVNGRLVTDVDLQPGTYVLSVNLFADVFQDFQNGAKVPPQDQNAAELMLFAGGNGTGWVQHPYLTPYEASFTFTLNEAQRVPVGIGLRGRYAIANNGWFVDNFNLRRVE